MTDNEIVSLRPQANAEPPLYMQQMSKAYWSKRLTSKTLYFQFNGVREMPERSIGDFANDLYGEIEDGRAS